MVSVTLSVPEELKKRMDTFPEINWSEIARQAFMQKMKQLEFMKRFASESDFSEDDALRIGKEINKSLAKKFRELK